MEHPVGVGEGRVQDIGLGDIATDVEDPHPRILEGRNEILLGAPYEVVEDQNLLDVLVNQQVDGVGAD